MLEPSRWISRALAEHELFEVTVVREP